MSDHQQQDDAAAADAARAKAEAILRVADERSSSSSSGISGGAGGTTAGNTLTKAQRSMREMQTKIGAGIDSIENSVAGAIDNVMSPTNAAGGGGGGSGIGGGSAKKRPEALAAINQELTATNQALRSTLTKAQRSMRDMQTKIGAGIDSIENSVAGAIDNVMSPTNAAGGGGGGSGSNKSPAASNVADDEIAALAQTSASTTGTAADDNKNPDNQSEEEIVQEAVDAKIMTDLAALSDQVNLCRSMLASSNLQTEADIKNDETLLAVIGFLEACSPRLAELINAGTTGSALGPEVVEKCLVVNDMLIRTLDDCDDPSKVTEGGETTGLSFHSATSMGESDGGGGAAGIDEGIPGELTAVSARTASERLMDDLLDFDLDDGEAAAAVAAAGGDGGGQVTATDIGGGGKTSGLE